MRRSWTPTWMGGAYSAGRFPAVKLGILGSKLEFLERLCCPCWGGITSAKGGIRLGSILGEDARDE